MVDGEAVTIKIRKGRSTDGIFENHARIVRELIPIRDAIREMLRQAGPPWASAGPSPRRLFGLHPLLRADQPHRDLVGRPTRRPAKSGKHTAGRTSRLSRTTPIAGWSPASRTTTSRRSRERGRSSRARHRAAGRAADHLRGRRARRHPERDRPRRSRPPGRPAGARPGRRARRTRHGGLPRSGDRPWETADAYLSGPVRTRLAVAEAAAALDPQYERNVTALRAVQPKDIRPSDITARLGAPWLPTDVMAFVRR